jgi:YppF-like protein
MMKEALYMDIRALQSKFLQSRDYHTDDVNELMDFAKKAYIQNEIDIREYRLLVRELEAGGAVIPNDNKENSLIENG